MTQSHGSNLWRETARSDAVPLAAPEYLVYAGPDVTVSLVGPSQLAWIDVDGSGDYRLIDLNPIDPVAHTYHDAGGAVWTVAPDAPRRAAVLVNGNVQFY